MDEERSGKGLWIILFIVALLAALTFATLWYLRGGELGRLNTTMSANQSAADANANRLERDLRTARSDVDAANRKATELETRFRDEQRRATETAQQTERRLRGEVDAANARLREMTSQLEQLRAGTGDGEAAGQPENPISPAELSDLRQQLADARSASEEKEKELYQRLADAMREKEELAGTVGDLKANISHIGQELTTANEDLQKLDPLQEQLAEARKTIENLRAQNAQLDNSHSSLKKELAAAGVAAVAAGAATEKISGLESKLAEAEKNLETANAELAKHKEQVARLEADAKKPAVVDPRLAELANELESVRKEKSAAESRIAGAQAEAKSAIAKLEEKIGDIEANNSHLRRELDSAVSELAKARENAAKNLAAVKKDYDERLTEARARVAAREKELRDEFEKAKAEQQQTPTPAKEEPASAPEAAAPAPETSAPAVSLAPAAASASVLEEVPIPLPRPEPTHYYVRDPERYVGDILEFASNGRYVINIGSRQGVKPGMRFDVHRPLGTMNWYIGALRIERTMSNTAEALTAPVEGVKICPVSGRAVLDKDSKYSPFAYADSGKPVPLISAESLGLGGEMPAAGDRVDNPFFDPARQLVFALDEDVRDGGSGAAAAVEAIGGRLLSEDDVLADADYKVVKDEHQDNATSTPRRVTVGQIASYSEK